MREINTKYTIEQYQQFYQALIENENEEENPLITYNLKQCYFKLSKKFFDTFNFKKDYSTLETYSVKLLEDRIEPLKLKQTYNNLLTTLRHPPSYHELAIYLKKENTVISESDIISDSCGRYRITRMRNARSPKDIFFVIA